MIDYVHDLPLMVGLYNSWRQEIVCIVNIDIKKPHGRWLIMLEGEAVRRSLPTQCRLQEEPSITDLLTEEWPQERLINYRFQQGEMDIASLIRNQLPLLLSQGKGHPPELLPLSNGLLFKMTPLNGLLLLKIMFLSFVCWPLLCFCCSLFVLDRKSLLFPSKPIVCW